MHSTRAMCDARSPVLRSERVLDARFPYLLRHTAASLLIDAGVPVEQVADLLGDDPRTLYRYYRHRVRPVVDAAAAPMQALFGPGAG